MKVINVIAQPEQPFKAASAREAWWQRIQKFNGKTLEAFLKDVAKNPPSLQLNGQYGKAGKVEPPSGWVSYFVRTKLAEIVEQAEGARRKRASKRKAA